MKKVISINFSGRLINIEEDAYSALQNYIESLKMHFANEEGKEEIIADIENRIAEIFYDKQSKSATSIGMDDVNQVMEMIGKPEDFDQTEETNTSSTTQQHSTQQKQFVGRGRLYRNSNDKFLGGVCSGVAAYFNIDTVLVRVIFIILLFGAGTGFFLYILLWIFVPESKKVNTSLEKRLYRNPDDRIFGGVSSGIAKYFSIDVWIPRLIFAAPFIFSFIKGISTLAYNNEYFIERFWNFSFGGTTTIVYFLLWWLIPEAKSVQEKMAMKGEKMDLNSIKNNIQDDLKTFGNKANAWGETVNQKASEWSGSFTEKAGEQSQRFTKATRSAGNKIGEGIGLAFKGFALFIGGTIAFSLLMTLIAALFAGFEFWPLRAFLLDNGWQELYFWGTFMLLLLPGIAFIVWLVRRITKSKKYSKQISVGFGILTFFGFAAATFLAASLSRSFKNHNDKRPAQEVAVTQPKNKLLLKVSAEEVQYSGTLPWVHIDEGGFDINRDSVKFANIKIRLDRSIDSFYHVKIKKYSRGSSVEDAETKAQRIQFTYTQMDSIFDIGSFITVSKNEKFRGQQVVVIVEIPVGKKISIDASVAEKLNPFNVRVSEKWVNGRRVYRNKGVVFDYENHFDYQTNVDYVMTEDGRLAPANKSINIEEDEDRKAKERQLEEIKRDLENKKKELYKDSIDKEIKKIEEQKEKLENKKREVAYLPNAEELMFKTPIVIPVTLFALGA